MKKKKKNKKKETIKISLKEKFDEYKDKNYVNDFEWDAPRGKEIW